MSKVTTHNKAQNATCKKRAKKKSSNKSRLWFKRSQQTKPKEPDDTTQFLEVLSDDIDAVDSSQSSTDNAQPPEGKADKKISRPKNETTSVPLVRKKDGNEARGQVHGGEVHGLNKVQVEKGLDTLQVEDTLQVGEIAPPHSTTSATTTKKRPGQKITEEELRLELAAGIHPQRIAERYSMSLRAVRARIAKLKSADLMGVVQGASQDGEPFLNTPEQISVLNKMTFDLIKSKKTNPQTKLHAIRRAEAQNELQLRVTQLLWSITESKIFQQSVLDTINELEETIPGVRELFLVKLKTRRDKEKNVLKDM